MSSPHQRSVAARAFWLDHFVPGDEVFSREGVRRIYELAVPPELHATDAVWMREGSRAVGAQTLWSRGWPLVGPLRQVEPTGKVAELLGFTDAESTASEESTADPSP
jgi:hypothetical protein